MHTCAVVPLFCPFIRDADFASRAPWHVAERRLLDFLLVYVQKGQCRFLLEERPYTLRDGEFFLVQPGEKIELRGETPTITPYLHFDLWFNPDREKSFATRPGQIDLGAFASLLQPRLDYLASVPARFEVPPDSWPRLKKIIEWWLEGTRVGRLQSQIELGALMLEVCRMQNVGQNRAPQEHNFALGWIPSFLSTHLSEEISVEHLAARARLSPSRFQAVFKEKWGQTPARFLRQMRVDHARELLETSDWTLEHIARLCGFADAHHLAKVFKRHTGQTPGQARRKEKN